tara:strand:- start:274 stop:648 length:375 start_codon:yes stop_codon:yes gene_type:complete
MNDDNQRNNANKIIRDFVFNSKKIDNEIILSTIDNHNHLLQTHDELAHCMQCYLILFEETTNKNKKIIILHKLFMFLCFHKSFVINFETLKHSAYKILIELFFEKKWEPAKYYFEQLFNKAIDN